MKKTILLLAGISLLALSCRKHDDDIQPTTSSPALSTAIVSDLANNVITATYNDLKTKADGLNQNVLAFAANENETNLAACKQSWRDCRSAYEQSEGFLFGPIASQNIDPHVDTWPVNFADLDSVLNSSAVFSNGYVDSLDDALKGFHPIEYLLFGTSGNKAATAFTPREISFLEALTLNLHLLTSTLATEWDVNTSGNYHLVFTSAGSGSTVYPTQRAAYEEMINAMADICNEVANGKISEPYLAQDPSLEESPFSFNSINDFTSNIRSVKNMYLGVYQTDGKGLEDLVRASNLSLDGEIKQKIDAALASLGAVTVPFGQAITQQPVQIQNCMNAINDLRTALENDLLPFVQTHTN